MDIKKYPYRLYLESDIVTKPETVRLRKEAASVLGIPKGEDRQLDLTYFTSIFVSSGTNLNDAHFLPSEMVLANESISGKAVDVEHKETEIIGHIYKHAYVDADYKELQVDDLLNQEVSSLDESELHIEIASVIYASRFPELAQEVEEKKWKVSMEAYYQNFDVKIGNIIMSQQEAKAAGFEVSNEKAYKDKVRVFKEGKVIAEGKPARVLRGVMFSGVGIVKNPANPPSVILETSSKKVVDINLDNIDDVDSQNNDNKVTSLNIDTSFTSKEESELTYNDTVGICVNYHKELKNDAIKNQSTEVSKTNWCSAFDQECTSFGHDASDANCLRNQSKLVAGVYASLYDLNDISSTSSSINELIEKLDKICKH